MKKPLYFLTHSGVGHADDLLAFSLALTLFPDIQLIRSRQFQIVESGIEIKPDAKNPNQPNFIENGSFIVADVGGSYNQDLRIYDHHQPNAPMRDDGHPYSAAGLFFKHFGHEILRHLNPNASTDVINDTFAEIDHSILLPIDLSDNTGCSFYEPDTEVRAFTFSDFIEMSRPGILTDFESLAKTISHLITVILTEKLLANIKGQELRRLADRCDEEVLTVDRFYPSAGKFLESTPIKILVHPNPEGKWNARWVKDGLFPQSWRGRSLSDLEKVSGVTGAIFCHRSGHLAVADQRQSAILLSEIALRSH
ncbi:MAG: MYG1 family protein [Leptonema sp. (in: Bacteria)]|nr:MYG1 family protein [Leptonema sp. (in: bacteria)]